MQIVFPQNQPERLKTEKITAAGIAQDVSPAAGIFDPLIPATGDRGTASRIHNDAIAMAQGRGQTGIAIAADDHFCLRPNLGAKPRKRVSILLRPTTR